VTRGVSVIATVILLVGLLVGPAGTASQNGATPPQSGGLVGQFLVAAEEMGDPDSSGP
jgi:hypothetical protein